MKKERHIYFDKELYQKITEYSLVKNKSIYVSVQDLVRLGIEADNNNQLHNEFKNTINKIDKNSYLTFILLKQLYSDLRFSNISDINKSEALNQFFRKLKSYRYDD